MRFDVHCHNTKSTKPAITRSGPQPHACHQVLFANTSTRGPRKTKFFGVKRRPLRQAKSKSEQHARCKTTEYIRRGICGLMCIVTIQNPQNPQLLEVVLSRGEADADHFGKQSQKASNMLVAKQLNIYGEVSKWS